MNKPLYCAKCQILRNTAKVLHHDKDTKKDWLITKCATCGFNIDLDETKIFPTSRSKWTLP